MADSKFEPVGCSIHIIHQGITREAELYMYYEQLYAKVNDGYVGLLSYGKTTSPLHIWDPCSTDLVLTYDDQERVGIMQGI